MTFTIHPSLDTKYRIELRNGNVIVGKYMGTNYAGDWLFNLRPDGGTAAVAKESIRKIEAV